MKEQKENKNQSDKKYWDRKTIFSAILSAVLGLGLTLLFVPSTKTVLIKELSINEKLETPLIIVGVVVFFVLLSFVFNTYLTFTDLHDTDEAGSDVDISDLV